MRSLLVVWLSVVCSCVDIAADVVVRAATGPNICSDPGVYCGKAAPGADAYERPVIARGRVLTKAAVEAARAGDCVKVNQIEHQILALPTVRLEGGIHGTIFLREPEIVKCLAAQRLAYDQCRRKSAGEELNPAIANPSDCHDPAKPPPPPPPPPPMTRDECTAQRDRMFVAATADAAKRVQLLRAIPSCPVVSTNDTTRERVWSWTIAAAIHAASGNCDSAVTLDPQVKNADPTHHDTTFVREPGIDQCLRAVAAYRVQRQRCVQERAAAMRRIQAIWDPTARAKELSLLRECPPVK